MRRHTPFLATIAMLATITCSFAGCSSDAGTTPTSIAGPSTTTPGSPPTARTSTPSSTALPTAPGVRAAAWRAVDARARSLGRGTTVFTGILGADGHLQIVHRTGPSDLRPLASVVKIYVLLAVLDRIEHGTLDWNTKLTTRGSDLAGGSGSLAGRGVGTPISVQDATRLMFQVSDNTATSLLVRTVGQAALRTAVRGSGHSRPAALDPFLTIRQDLWLQWSADPAAVTARARWNSASAAQRSALIAPADTGAPPDLTRSGNIWRLGLGYGGSAEDVARAWAAIAVHAKKPGMAMLSRILTVPSPGFIAPAGWRTTWFKSGSLAGVQNGSWLGDGPHGRQVVVVLSASDGSPSVSAVRGLATSAASVLDAYAAGR